jgi:hypothetical protein
MDLVKVVLLSSTDTYLTSSHDGNKVMDIKVEVTDIQEETNVMKTFSVIKGEHEVSCMCVYCWHISQVSTIFIVSASPSVSSLEMNPLR